MAARVWTAVAAIALGIALQPSIPGWAAATAGTAGLVALLQRRRVVASLIGAASLACAAGWIAAAFHRADGADVRAAAQDFPRCRVAGRVLEHAGGLGTLVSIDSADCLSAERAVAIVPPLDVSAGTRVSASGWLTPLGRNEFDAARARTGADAEFAIDSLRTEGVAGRAHEAAGAFRASLDRAAESLPGERRGLVLGMAIGDTSHIGELTLDRLRRAGLTHLLAVSGSNVAIVMGVVALCLRRVSLGLRIGAGALALAFYVLVVGPDPSVLRAGVMGAIALVALWRGVETQTLHLLGAALAALLLLRPGMLYAPGLHLSAAATAGIVLWAPALADRFARLPRPVALALAATLAAQFAVAPVLLATFGEISLVAPVANVLAFPAVAPVTVGGLLAGAIGLLHPGAAELLLSLVSPLAGWVLWVGTGSGAPEWASLAVPSWAAAPAAVVVSLVAYRSLRQPCEEDERPPRDDAGMGEWHWRLHDAGGRDLRTTESFATKEEAEEWLGSEWQALADEGAESVSLVRGDAVSYTMGLREE